MLILDEFESVTFVETVSILTDDVRAKPERRQIPRSSPGPRFIQKEGADAAISFFFVDHQARDLDVGRGVEVFDDFEAHPGHDLALEASDRDFSAFRFGIASHAAANLFRGAGVAELRGQGRKLRRIGFAGLSQ